MPPGPFRPSKVWTGHRQLFPTYYVPQIIPKCLVHHAILHPPVTSSGSASLEATVEDQFLKYTYPIPKEEGGTEVHLIWMDNPCRTACWNCGYESIEAYRSPKIECFVVQHPWLENDCVFADIILPVNTKLEEEDIASCSYAPIKGVILEEKAIEPVGESLSDYEAVGEVAKKLGLYEEYTEGRTIKESIKNAFDQSKLGDYITWQKFQKQGYFFCPTDPNWEDYPAGLRPFYEDPGKNPLKTPTGQAGVLLRETGQALS